MPSPTTWSNTEIIEFSGSNLVDSLLHTNRWSNNTVSYSFPDYDSYWSTDPLIGYGESSGFGEPWVGFSPLYDSDMFYASNAFDAWSNVANIQLIEVVDNEFTVGDIRISYSEADVSDYAVYAYDPYNSPVGGDIWIDPLSVMGEYEWSVGTYSYFVILHEIGHAIGLGHPHEGDVILDSTFDTQTLTVMSYDADPLDPSSFLSFMPTTPMILDTLAIQYIYGVNYDFNSGDDIYFFDDSTPYHETIWDGGGNDSIVYDGLFAVTIDLNQGSSSRIGIDVSILNSDYSINRVIDNIWIAAGVDIENALGGAGNDELIGNDVANNLYGAEGDDELEGGAGNDYLDGGTGIDTAKYAGNHANYDIQITSIVDNFTSDGVDTLTNIERLEFADINVALDLDGNAGQAYRIYKAAFDRTPDLTGLGYWINDLDAGASLLDVSAGFTHSNEFYGLYGENSSNLDFITLLYNNVLDRDPDEGGYAYWLNELDNGISTREGILTGFSESAENQLAVIELIANGIEYTEWVG